MQAVEKNCNVENSKVAELLEARLVDFCNKVEESKILEIDTLMEGETEGFKIINSFYRQAFFVPIEVLIKTRVVDLIKALETNEFQNLQAITRIVGYYSRVHNWNKSKIGELQDRARGAYSIGNGVKVSHAARHNSKDVTKTLASL